MAGIPSDSVRIILTTPDDQFVLVCEADDPGNWKLPGGKVEHMEEPDLAAARELHEELGVDAETVGLHLAQQLMNDDGIHSRWIYGGRIDSAELLRPSAEISELLLCRKDSVPDCPNRQHILTALEAVTNNN